MIFFFQRFLQFTTTSENLLRLLSHLENNQDPADNTCITGNKQKDIVDHLLKTSLFPEKVFMIFKNYLPLRVTKKNLDLAFDTTKVVVSKDILDGDGLYTGVSYSSCISVKEKPLLMIHFYVERAEVMFAHLRCQLRHLRQQISSGKESADMQIAFPTEISLSKVKDVLVPAIGHNIKYGDTSREKILILDKPLLYLLLIGY